MIDVLCFAEHWISSDQINLINLDQYKLRSQFCRTKKKGGGSCIFVRDILKTKQTHYLSVIGQEKDFELSAVELLDIKTVIVSIYRSPESDLDEFLAKLEIVMRRIQENKKRHILCGDWNVNLLHSNSKLHKVQNVL
jgi:exonuclease III